MSRAPTLICDVVYHAASKRLIGLFQRHSKQFCLRSMSLATLKAETVAFDTPPEEFRFFRSKLGLRKTSRLLRCVCLATKSFFWSPGLQWVPESKKRGSIRAKWSY